MPERLAAVDPGEHVGTAIWERGQAGRWECVAAREVDPDRFADSLYKLLGDGLLHRVAFESFRLGGGQEALRQRGSTFPTVEVIGQLKLLCRWHGVPTTSVERGQRDSALTRMRAVGWRFPRGVSDHVRDAIAVGAVATGWRGADHYDGDGMHPRS